MTAIGNLHSNIDLMERIHKVSLSNTTYTKQPGHIVTQLFPHQLYSLERMKEIEGSIHKGMYVNNEQIFSSYGILGERSGTGKTLTMLAHISQMSLENTSATTHTLHSSSIPSFFSITKETPTNFFDTLVVVPHALFHQWQEEVEKTHLSCHLLKTLKDIDSPTCIQNMLVSHVTIISNTLLQSLAAVLTHTGNYIWSRVVYDEADIIRIPSACPFIRTKMTWLITSRYRNITHANQNIHSHVVKQLSSEYVDTLCASMRSYILKHIIEHPILTVYKCTSEQYFKSIIKNNHPSRGYFVVTTDELSLNESMPLPPMIRSSIMCIHEGYRPNQTLAFLNAGRIEDAVLSINPSIMTIECLLEKKDTNIQRRLQDNTTCSICYESAYSLVPCITPCCMNLFCGRCILTWFDINNKCPLCQSVINGTSLIHIKNADASASPTPTKEKTKFEALASLLEVNAQYILFSRDIQKVYTYIKNNTTIDIDILHGNKSTIANMIHDFKTKKTRILLFSDDTLGVNLHSASHIILMDRLSIDEEDYILGRAQRIGRREPLHVINLLYIDE
jgi:hypothetical protein